MIKLWLVRVKKKGVRDPIISRYRSIVYPSKNRSAFATDAEQLPVLPMYQVKFLCHTWKPCRKVSRTAFNLDLVVGVSQPHDDNVISPNDEINAMRLPCRYTLVSPSEFLATSVLDFLQVSPLLREVIADCISLSILRMCALGEVLFNCTNKKTPLVGFSNKLKQFRVTLQTVSHSC